MVLLALVLGAVLTRAYGLTAWNFHGDELFTVRSAAERSTGLINPAYYMLVSWAFRSFGISEWSARLPAMLIGVLSIPAMYVFSRNIIGRNAALFAALLTIFSASHLEFSQFSRYYSGVFLFGLLSYFLYYRALQLDSVSLLIAAFASNILGILFHATSVLVPVSCALFSAVFLLSKKSEQAGYSRRVAVIHLGVSTAVALITYSFFSNILENWVGREQGWGYGPVNFSLQLVYKIQIPIAISAFFGITVLLKKARWQAFFFIIAIAVPALALLTGSTITDVRPQYMFYALPIVLCAAAVCCEEVRQALSHQKLASYGLSAIVFAALLPGFISHYTLGSTLDVRAAVGYVKDAYRPGDHILSFSNEFKYYLGEGYALEKPLGSSLGEKAANSVEWKEALEPYVERSHRLWIIFPVYRNKSLAEGLENWLLRESQLVWRRQARSYDYSLRGYEVFLARERNDYACAAGG